MTSPGPMHVVGAPLRLQGWVNGLAVAGVPSAMRGTIYGPLMADSVDTEGWPLWSRASQPQLLRPCLLRGAVDLSYTEALAWEEPGGSPTPDPEERLVGWAGTGRGEAPTLPGVPGCWLPRLPSCHPHKHPGN